MTVLELRNVRKTYSDGDSEIVALEHASLSLGDNEMLALMGPSGSGKSTLLSIAGGLLAPTGGEVLVGGEDITGYSGRQLTDFRRRKVGFVFQSVNLVPFLTARENLLVVSHFARGDRSRVGKGGAGKEGVGKGGAGRKATGARADELLGQLGLDHRSASLPAQLSGGERQRVAIGRALMNNPELVLVDEPTSALDSHLGEQVMRLLVREIKDRGTAAVIVTHDARVVPFADRTLTITDGLLGAEGPPTAG